MNDGIKHLIECEMRAQKRLENIIEINKNIGKEAQKDAEVIITQYKKNKEEDLIKIRSEYENNTRKLLEKTENEYLEIVNKNNTESWDEITEKLIKIITLN